MVPINCNEWQFTFMAYASLYDPMNLTVETRHDSDTFDGKIVVLFGGHLGKLESSPVQQKCLRSAMRELVGLTSKFSCSIL